MGDQEARMRLADQVVGRRVQLGMSRRDLANAAHVHEGTVGEIERGRQVSRSTLGAVEVALRWEAGSTRSILGGGAPVVANPGHQLEPPLQRILDDPDLTAKEKIALIALTRAMRENAGGSNRKNARVSGDLIVNWPNVTTAVLAAASPETSRRPRSSLGAGWLFPSGNLVQIRFMRHARPRRSLPPASRLARASMSATSSRAVTLLRVMTGA